jgi:hypothetical protein
MENTVIEQTTEYELRPMVASDMGAVCKIITAIGIRQFKECFNMKDLENIDKNSVKSIGIGVFFDIAGIVISNIPKAEREIQAFVASLTGLQMSDIEKMPFAEYGELIVRIVTKDDFRDFFGRVMKLLNH